MNKPATDIPIVFLAGGKGTRLATHDPTRPKPMVLVHGKPFLHWLTKHYVRLGYRDFLFSTCHMAEQIENYEWKKDFPDCRFDFVRETKPLGTGGAIQNIFSVKKTLQSAWIINGDTLLPNPLPRIPKNCEAIYTVLSESEVFDATPNLIVEADMVIQEYKGGDLLGGHSLYFDGGAVFVTRIAVERYKGSTPCSMHELLKPTMGFRRACAAIVEGTCYDIGTPERFKRFENYVESKKD